MIDENTGWYKKGLIEYAVYNIEDDTFLMAIEGGYCWVPPKERRIALRADQVDSYIAYMQASTIDENICNEETGTNPGITLIAFVNQTAGWDNVMFIPAIMTGEVGEDGIKKSKIDYVRGFKV